MHLPKVNLRLGGAQAKLWRYGTILEPPVEPRLSLQLHRLQNQPNLGAFLRLDLVTHFITNKKVTLCYVVCHSVCVVG